MPLDDGYRAASGNLILDSYDLAGFGSRFEELLAARMGSTVEVEWGLSKNLKPQFHACRTCNGHERVEIEGVGLQNMRDDYDSIDFTKHGTTTCPTCRGLGVEIRNFWQR